MSRVTLLALQIMVAVVAVALWYALSTYPVFGKILLPPFFFSNPLDVAKQIVDWFASGVIWKHLWVTLEESMLAFVIGSIGGVLVGFWFARQPRTAAVFDPYVKMVNALPRVVLAPIFTLWLGLGIWSKVALGVTLVFFIVFFNVYQGVKEVSPTVLANARMLGMNERQLMRHVYWPSALSWMFSSLHTSVGFAVVGAVVGEYLGSAAGLGYLIQQAEGVFDVAGVFAGMFVLAAFVIVIDTIVTVVEKRLLVWRPAARRGPDRAAIQIQQPIARRCNSTSAFPASIIFSPPHTCVPLGRSSTANWPAGILHCRKMFAHRVNTLLPVSNDTARVFRARPRPASDVRCHSRARRSNHALESNRYEIAPSRQLQWPVTIGANDVIKDVKAHSGDRVGGSMTDQAADRSDCASRVRDRRRRPARRRRTILPRHYRIRRKQPLGTTLSRCY